MLLLSLWISSPTLCGLRGKIIEVIGRKRKVLSTPSWTFCHSVCPCWCEKSNSATSQEKWGFFSYGVCLSHWQNSQVFSQSGSKPLPAYSYADSLPSCKAFPCSPHYSHFVFLLLPSASLCHLFHSLPHSNIKDALWKVSIQHYSFFPRHNNAKKVYFWKWTHLCSFRLLKYPSPGWVFVQCVCECMHRCTWICMHVLVNTCVSMNVDLSIHAYRCAYVCMGVHMCLD